MAWGMAALQLTRVHVPPALAVALLPMVMDTPTVWYPISVGVGTLALTLWFWYCRDRIEVERAAVASDLQRSSARYRETEQPLR
jgi:hypothetical protein